MAGVTFDQVSKIYPDGTRAVNGLDLEIADDEFMVLVGPSGCGKTTALRMIAGLEEITSGNLLIGGDVVNDLSPARRDVSTNLSACLSACRSEPQMPQARVRARTSPGRTDRETSSRICRTPTVAIS